MAVITEVRQSAPPPAPSRAAAPMAGAALCSLAAAAIHFAFAPAHFDQRTSHGAFFLALALFQAGWALAAALAPSRLVAWAGLLNIGVIAVWAVSRTAGIDGKEAVGYPDVLAGALELGVLVLSVLWLTGRRFRLAGPAAAMAVLVLGGSTAYALTPRFADAHDHAHAASGAATTTPCEASGPPVSPAQFTEGHDHRGPQAQQPVDRATRAALMDQQVRARSVATKYPTVADAVKSGYRMSTPFVPCIGAHYTNIGLVARFDPAAPSELLYDGTQPDAKLVGLSYLVYHPGGAPEGFAGPNDVWHQHNANGGLCFNRAGVVIGGEQSTTAECAQLGGAKRELTDVWMLHDWVVPGWECSWGVFAPECPELGGRTGASAWD
jgi:4-amino-4-deoxy-L-arabinose transferase-like glycosyltransferase